MNFHTKTSIKTKPVFKRSIVTWGYLIALLGLILTSLNVFAAGTQGVCPTTSAFGKIKTGDFNFTMGMAKDCMWVLNDHYNETPRAYKRIGYHIYCPGRMSPRASRTFGQLLTRRHFRIKDSSGRTMNPNPVIQQHDRVRLSPKWVGTPHRFEYWCNNRNHKTVATHVRVDIEALPRGGGARHCRFHGSQNGDIALNKRMDREYKCIPHFGNHDKSTPVVWNTAVDLVRRDLITRARRLHAKICVLKSTNIQCAPCRTSDKLIVRVLTVPLRRPCPSRYAPYREVR